MYEIFKNWNNGERITMWLFNKCWEVEIEWCNYYCMFGLGWSKFVEEVDIRIGDSCIFECTGNRLEFNICIERDEEHDFFIVNPGDFVFILLSFYIPCDFEFVFNFYFCLQICTVLNSFKLYSISHWKKIKL